jgi:hypothetical protein
MSYLNPTLLSTLVVSGTETHGKQSSIVCGWNVCDVRIEVTLIMTDDAP